MKFNTWVPCWFKIKVNCGVKTQAEFITDVCAEELPARFVREGSSVIAALLRQKWLLILNDYSVRFCGTSGSPNLSQNYFTGNLNTAPEVQGAWFLSVLCPVWLVGEMWDITRSECIISTCFVPICVCCSTGADLTLGLWWCGMSRSGLPAEFHRDFLNKVTESVSLPSISCCLTSAGI